MKVNVLEAHDRFKEFSKQADYISKGCQDCIDNRPKEFGNRDFYVFTHKRELGLDERISMYNKDVQECILNPFQIRKYFDLKKVPTARLIWSPRLTKPKPQENSMLFRVTPPDIIEVIWMIPDAALFDQYEKGDVIENATIKESIHHFLHNRQKFEKIDGRDISDKEAAMIYEEISRNSNPLKAINEGNFDNFMLKI